MQRVLFLLAAVILVTQCATPEKQLYSIPVRDINIDAEPRFLEKLLKRMHRQSYRKMTQKNNRIPKLIGNKQRGCRISESEIVFFYKPKESPNTVYVCGSLNNWQIQDPEYKLKAGADGVFRKQIEASEIAVENLAFIFIVDGKFIYEEEDE